MYKKLAVFSVLFALVSFMAWFTVYAGSGVFVPEGSVDQSFRFTLYVPADQTNPGNPVTTVTEGNTQIYYWRDLGATANVAVTVGAANAIGTHTPNKVTHRINGEWEVNLDDNLFAAGADTLTVTLVNDADEFDAVSQVFQLIPWDINDPGLGLSLDDNIYQLVGTMMPNDGAGADQYGVAFLTNGVVETAATDFKIAVVRISDGVNLVASIGTPQDVDAEVGATDIFEYTEATNRMLNDELYILYGEATIGGSTRSDKLIISRDSWKNTLTELTQGIPAAEPEPGDALMALYMALRNQLQVTTTVKRIHDDAGTVIFKKDLSDDGTTYQEDEAVAGP